MISASSLYTRNVLRWSSTSSSTQPMILYHLYHQFHDLNRILQKRRRGLQEGIQLDHHETTLLAVLRPLLATARSLKVTMTQGHRDPCVRWCHHHLRMTTPPATKIQVTWGRWAVGGLLELVQLGSVRRTAIVRHRNSRSRRRYRRQRLRESELGG